MKKSFVIRGYPKTTLDTIQLYFVLSEIDANKIVVLLDDIVKLLQYVTIYI